LSLATGYSNYLGKSLPPSHESYSPNISTVTPWEGGKALPRNTYLCALTLFFVLIYIYIRLELVDVSSSSFRIINEVFPVISRVSICSADKDLTEHYCTLGTHPFIPKDSFEQGQLHSSSIFAPTFFKKLF
jgi:hypothetical protein